jgi:GNAT superfamily N-acetyltransferase
MTDLEIRPLTPDDDMDAQVDLGERAFGPMPAVERASWTDVTRLCVSQGTVLGAFVAGRPAGAATVHDMRQWWQGRAVPSAGVASVKVAPEHRGQGIGRRLMTAVLDLIAEHGYPVSALYPATMPLYRSLGWELAGGRSEATVPARSLHSLLPPDPDAPAAAPVPVGSPVLVDLPVPVGPPVPAAGAPVASGPNVRRAGPGDAAAVNEIIGRTHEAARDCGPVTWDVARTERWLAREDMYAYLTDDGFAAYRWDAGGHALFVERVQGVSAETVRALWSVIASHNTIARTVRTVIAPAGPLWWLTAERDVTVTKREMWMLRVVDASAAIESRGFPPGVSVTVPLVITDHSRPANSGHWELTVSEGKGILIPNGPGILGTPPGLAPQTGRLGEAAPRATLTLGARGLAALYAGTPVTTLRLAGLAAGGTPEADASLDAAFAATPYMLDAF